MSYEDGLGHQLMRVHVTMRHAKVNRGLHFRYKPDLATADVAKLDVLYGTPKEVLFADTPAVRMSKYDEHGRARCIPYILTINNVALKEFLCVEAGRHESWCKLWTTRPQVTKL